MKISWWGLCFSVSLSSASANSISGTDLLLFTEQQLSSVAVAAKQMAVAANQISLGEIAAAQAKTAALLASDSAERMKKTLSDNLSLTSSHALLSCDLVTQETSSTKAFEQQKQDSRTLTDNLVNKDKSLVERQRNRVANRLSRYCTVAAAQMKLCELESNGMQGVDGDYSKWANSLTLAPELEVAAYDFVETMVSQHEADTKMASCQSVHCEQFNGAVLQVQAFESLIAHSLVSQVTVRRIVE